jgi:hypothetical protein
MSCERLKNIQTEIKALLNNPNANNQDYKNFYAKYGIPYSNKVEVEIKNNCGVINAQIASNIIEIPESCVDASRKLCLAIDKDGPGSWKYEQCMNKYGPRIRNIYQSNVSNITSTCITNTILGDPELAANKNLGVVVAMIMADRIINCNPAENNNYYDAFSSDEKIKVINECVNSSIVEQKNYLSGCRLENKLQQNISENIDTCIIKTKVSETMRPTQRPITTRPPITTRRPITTRLPITTRSPITTRPPINTRSPTAVNIKPTTITDDITIPPTSDDINLLPFILIGLALVIIIIVVILKIKKII